MTDKNVLFPPPTAPLDVAKQLYERYQKANDLHTLLSWRGSWMQWHETHWAEMDSAALRSVIYKTLGDAKYEPDATRAGKTKPWRPDKRKVANVMEALAAVSHLSSDIDPPSWLGSCDPPKPDAAQVISCANGLLDLSTRTITAHTPEYFNVVSVPFDYDPSADEPREWLRFLDSVWHNEEDCIDLLQEYFGYVLSGRTDMQKMLLLVGPTRSGKGTIARVLTALIGRDHVSGPTLASLGATFGLAPLLGKSLAVVSDARLGPKAQSDTIVERLLSITGEDVLSVDRKFRDAWTGRLPTRFVILTNELPRFRDASAAIAGRMLILPMTESFLGREDRELSAKLEAELPAILNWALDGLARLNHTGRFTVPKASDEAATLIRDMASPVSAFIRECCEVSPSFEVPSDKLFSAWKTWAEEAGHHPGSKATFGRDLRAVVPTAKLYRPRNAGRQVRHYTGIALCNTLNAELPDSPDSPTETAGQSRESESGDPDSLRGSRSRQQVESGVSRASVTQPNDIKPQVNGAKPEFESGESGKSAFKVLQLTEQAATNAGTDTDLLAEPHAQQTDERSVGPEGDAVPDHDAGSAQAAVDTHTNDCQICGQPINKAFGTRAHYDCAHKAGIADQLDAILSDTARGYER